MSDRRRNGSPAESMEEGFVGCGHLGTFDDLIRRFQMQTIMEIHVP